MCRSGPRPHLDRHEQQRPRSRLRSARRSGRTELSLLRVQLRQRARWRCGRRCSPPRSAPQCSTGRPIRPPTRSSGPRPVGRLRGTPRHVPRGVQRRRDCAFHNGGDAEGAFDALMAELDDQPLPSADGRAPVSRDVATDRRRAVDVLRPVWPALAGALDDAAGGDGAGLLQLTTPTTGATPTARTAT